MSPSRDRSGAAEPTRESEAPGPSDPHGGDVPRRVWNATLLQVAGRVFGAACTLIALALLARHLSAAEFGRYTFFIAVFMLLDSLTDFGSGQVAVQRTANDAWALSGTLRTLRRMRLGMAALGLLLVATVTRLQAEQGALWILAATGYEFTHALELSAVVFRNRIVWGIPVAVRAFAAAVRLGVIVALIAAGADSAPVFLFGTALGSSCANLLLHLAARRHLPLSAMPVRPPRGLLRACVPLGLASLCQQLYFYVDNLFIRGLVGDEPLGQYNAGVRLLSFGIMVAQYASLAALPWLTRAHARGELGTSAARLGAPLLVGAAAVAGLASPHTEALLHLVFGSDFMPGGASLRWLLGAMAMIYAGATFTTAVVASGSTRAVFVTTAVGLGVNLAGNAWLVPLRGIEGAALATFATELVVVIGALIALARIRVYPLRERPLLWLAAPLAYAAAYGLSALAR